MMKRIKEELDEKLTGIFVFLLIVGAFIYGSVMLLGPDNPIE